jgi:hypothetical protein
MTTWLWLTVCFSEGTLERGTVHVCLEGDAGEVLDQEMLLHGVVGAAAPGSVGDSTRTFTVDDEKGSFTFGFGIEDGDGTDITPALEAGPGDEVSLLQSSPTASGRQVR